MKSILAIVAVLSVSAIVSAQNSVKPDRSISSLPSPGLASFTAKPNNTTLTIQQFQLPGPSNFSLTRVSTLNTLSLNSISRTAPKSIVTNLYSGIKLGDINVSGIRMPIYFSTTQSIMNSRTIFATNSSYYDLVYRSPWLLYKDPWVFDTFWTALIRDALLPTGHGRITTGF
jgi:hypothetical protein